METAQKRVNLTQTGKGRAPIIAVDSGLLQAREFVISVPAVNRWIPCSKMLPEKHVEVLAYSPYWGKIVVAMWGGEFWLEQWTDDDLEQSEISHWMPLPEPPKEADNE